MSPETQPAPPGGGPRSHGPVSPSDRMYSPGPPHRADVTLSRHHFLVIAGLGILASASAVPALVKSRNIDLDAIDHMIESTAAQAFTHATGKEHLARVLAQLERLHVTLLRAPFALTDPRMVRSRVRAGMLLGALQETVLAWQGERVQVAVRTYSVLLRDIFPAAHPAHFTDAYVRTLVRQAVLMREADHLADCHQLLDQAEAFLAGKNDVCDPRLLVALKCQRVHTLAVQGLLSPWQQALEETRHVAETLGGSGDLQEQLRAIVTYTEGVGYKRFMWRRRQERISPMRQMYADHVVTCLAPLLDTAMGSKAAHNVNAYHQIVPDTRARAELESSIIDALVWCQPHAALQQAAGLRPRLNALYPSLEAKLDAQVALARTVLARGT